MTKEKPPTIRVGVQGIERALQNGDDGFTDPIAEALQSIDWVKLVQLPPFQMFASESGAITAVMNYDQWSVDLLDKLRHGHVNAQQLYTDYSAWHKQNGYWPNEDPMGNLVASR